MPEHAPAGRVFSYLRLSKNDALTGSCSLEWQRATILAWLTASGNTMADECADNGVSGRVRIAKRKGGSSLVDRATHDGDIIVVAKLDRLSRNVEDFRWQLRHWLAAGVRLVTLDHQLDYTRPQDRFFATILVAAAELEPESTSERTLAANATRAAAGLRGSGAPKYGWRGVPFGSTRADGSRDQRIEADPREQLTLLAIADLWGRCWSLQAISDELRQRGMRPRHGKRWARSTLSDLTRNLADHLAPPASAAGVGVTDSHTPPGAMLTGRIAQ